MFDDQLKDLNNRRNTIGQHIMKSFTNSEPDIICMTEEVFNEAFEKGIIVEFEDVQDDNLEKSLDKTKLQQKKITDRKGHTRNVWVKREQNSASKDFNPNGLMQKKELTKEDIESVKGHEHKLSHINKVRFDREHEKHFGKQDGEPLITHAMASAVKEMVGDTDNEKLITNAMRMFAQKVGNTYTISEINQMYNEYMSFKNKDTEEDGGYENGQKYPGDDEVSGENSKYSITDDNMDDLLNIVNNGWDDKTAKRNFKRYTGRSTTDADAAREHFEEDIRDMRLSPEIVEEYFGNSGLFDE